MTKIKSSNINIITLSKKNSLYLKLGKTDQQRKNNLIFIVITLFIISIVIYFSTGYRKLDSHKFFINSLNSNDYKASKIYLEDIKYVFKSKYSEYNYENSAHLSTAKDRYSFIVSLISVLDNIHSNNHTKALKTLRDLRRDLAKNTTGTKTRDMVLYSYLLKDFNNIVSDYKVYKLTEAKNPKQIKDNEARINQLSLLAQDLANEFGLLLGLSSENLVNSNKRSIFYTEGLLKGLPILKGLPDKIEDLNKLKVELKKAGGAVSIRGKDTPKIFMERLDSLRKQSFIFENQIKKLQEENSTLSEELKTYKVKYYNHSLKLSSAIKDFIIEYLRP